MLLIKDLAGGVAHWWGAGLARVRPWVQITVTPVKQGDLTGLAAAEFLLRTVPGEAGLRWRAAEPGAVHRVGADGGGWAVAAMLPRSTLVQVVLCPL